MLEKRFIESVKFPFSDVSEASGVEKGPGRPPHWEVVFWWTRKPLISARAIIAGCLLPENTNPTNFLRSIGIVVRKHRPDGRSVFEESPHRVKPRLRFDGIKLLDPFACFGSIPLEGLRLGLSATACDLLPVGYVFLKAILEYPTKYGAKLVEDVKKWGKWVVERLEEDPLVKELYDKDVVAYIGSWEIICPSCGKFVPLVGKWWLLIVKGDKGYDRLVWMEPRIVHDKIDIDIVDLNKILGDNVIKKAKIEGLKVKIGDREFRVPESNIEARREKAVCLQCGQSIIHIDPVTGRCYTETKNLSDEVKQRLKGYVKFALKLYNEEIDGSAVLPEWLNQIPARLRLLVKVKIVGGELEFEPCTEKDQEKLKIARSELEKLLEKGDPDVPKEAISLYSARYLFPILYGMTEWYKLFNPRQLLTLVKLTKTIREAGRLIEQEKIREGLSQEDSFKYAEAIVTWLSMIFLRYVDYNTMCTVWNYGGHWGLHAQIAHTLSMRGIAMMWNWGDVFPSAEMGGTGTFTVSFIKAIKSLNYLTSTIGNPNTVLLSGILLDDATVLSKLIPDEKFDLIITDPPYYDDVPYCELSDFYYIWLKRTLSDIENNRLRPKFLPEAFFEKIGDDWVEVSTQWEKYALAEVSLNPPRLGHNTTKDNGVKHFQNLLNASFITMTSKLKDDGLLVAYYAHTSPDAWKSLLEAGWQAAGLRITNAFPIATEFAESVVARGKLSMDTSIVVVWRGFSGGLIDAPDLYSEMVEESAKRARELLDLGAIGRDLVVGTLAASLAAATKYHEVRVMGKIDVGTLVDRYVYPASYLGLARALARKAELKDGVRSPDGMFYLLVKSTLAGAKKKTLDSTDARIFSIGTSLDLNTALKTWRILKAGEKESGAKVAKAKTITLMEPTSTDKSKLAELLEARGVGVTEPSVRCTVDALHLLEYLAVAYSREEFKRKLEELKASHPTHVEDALNIARIMAKVLPAEDTEKGLCGRIIEYLEPITPELRKFNP